MTATQILEAGKKVLEERGKTYAPGAKEGERNMKAIVTAFNTIRGLGETDPGALTTAEGWLFMGVLKMVRAASPGEKSADHFIDLANYAALLGEEVTGGRHMEPVVKAAYFVIHNAQSGRFLSPTSDWICSRMGARAFSTEEQAAAIIRNFGFIGVDIVAVPA